MPESTRERLARIRTFQPRLQKARQRRELGQALTTLARELEEADINSAVGDLLRYWTDQLRRSGAIQEFRTGRLSRLAEALSSAQSATDLLEARKNLSDAIADLEILVRDANQSWRSFVETTFKERHALGSLLERLGPTAAALGADLKTAASNGLALARNDHSKPTLDSAFRLADDACRRAEEGMSGVGVNRDFLQKMLKGTATLADLDPTTHAWLKQADAAHLLFLRLT